jgi:hypothetical protein
LRRVHSYSRSTVGVIGRSKRRIANSTALWESLHCVAASNEEPSFGLFGDLLIDSVFPSIRIGASLASGDGVHLLTACFVVLRMITPIDVEMSGERSAAISLEFEWRKLRGYALAALAMTVSLASDWTMVLMIRN